MGNIFVNGRPVCDDYADKDNNAAVVVCRFAESSSLKISAPNHTMLISVTPSEIEVALPEAIFGWINIQYYIYSIFQTDCWSGANNYNSSIYQLKYQIIISIKISIK